MLLYALYRMGQYSNHADENPSDAFTIPISASKGKFL